MRFACREVCGAFFLKLVIDVEGLSLLRLVPSLGRVLDEIRKQAKQAVRIKTAFLPRPVFSVPASRSRPSASCHTPVPVTDSDLRAVKWNKCFYPQVGFGQSN